MFKSFSASWNKSSLVDKCLISYLGLCAVVVVVSNVIIVKNKTQD